MTVNGRPASELADSVRTSAADPLNALRPSRPIVQQPANPIRSVARLVASEVEDKSWFHDRSFWPRYFAMLAAQRFNRFALTLGLGYDFTRQIRDAYLHFAYPFLVSVRGYKVRVVGLPDEEWGEVVIAAVVCDQPSDRLATELIQFCRERLGRHKAPHEIRFLDALPRNDLGKLLRKHLRDQMLSTSSSG